MAMTGVFRPGVMISQTWPTACDSDGATLDAFVQVIEDGFFQAVQTVQVSSSAERHRIADLVRQTGLHYTYNLARLQNRQGLNLSSLNHTDRKKSVDVVTALIDDAREAGASSVCVVSGPRPLGEAERVAGLESLQDSMQRIAGAAMVSPQVELLIEPLDYFADKKHTLGTVREGLELCNSVNLQGQNLGLCVDTAHMLLNGERFANKPGSNLGQPAVSAGKPTRTKNAISPEITSKHTAQGVVRGIKESSGNREPLAAYYRVRQDLPQFEVYVSNDSLILHVLELGSSGCVSGLANIITSFISGLCKRFRADDRIQAQLLQQQIFEIRTAAMKGAIVQRKLLPQENIPPGDNLGPRRLHLLNRPEMKSISLRASENLPTLPALTRERNHRNASPPRLLRWGMKPEHKERIS